MSRDSENILALIEEQIEANRGRGLFSETAWVLSPGLEGFLLALSEEIPEVLENSRKELEGLIPSIKELVLSTVYAANQYYQFNEDQRDRLEVIYQDLLERLIAFIKTRPSHEAWKKEIAAIVEDHHLNLREWLAGANPFAAVTYEGISEVPRPVCAQYSAELQMELLGLGGQPLMEPILDVGCGKDYRLVKHLRDLGLTAFGLDRIIDGEAEYLIEQSWLEYQFEPAAWGTIVSHMGFSNHFLFHYVRKSEAWPKYALKFKEMLEGLRTGGTLAYAPSLPFIEAVLDADRHRILRRKYGSIRVGSVDVAVESSRIVKV